MSWKCELITYCAFVFVLCLMWARFCVLLGFVGGVFKSGCSGSSLKESKIQKLEEQGINIHGESE